MAGIAKADPGNTEREARRPKHSIYCFVKVTTKVDFFFNHLAPTES